MKTIIITIVSIILIQQYLFSQKYEAEQKIKDAMDYNNQITRDFSLLIARKYNGKKFKQLSKIYEYLHDKWSYVNDPYGEEYFAKASESCQVLAGDCDDYAVLMASCLYAIGFNTRVLVTEGHAYAEVYAGSTKKELKNAIKNIKDSFFWMSLVSDGVHYHVEDSGYWINLDWTSVYPGGKYANDGNYYFAVYP